MRAILSVSDKTGLVELARGLAGLGVELISTGGTARAIAAAGLPVTNVSDVTGFPEMMDGRREDPASAMFGGILARRNRPDDLAAIAAQGIRPIDIVVVNLYPFGRRPPEPRHAVRRAGRGNRHRRPEPGPGRREELPRRAGRGQPGGLHDAARGARATRRAVARLPLRA